MEESEGNKFLHMRAGLCRSRDRLPKLPVVDTILRRRSEICRVRLTVVAHILRTSIYVFQCLHKYLMLDHAFSCLSEQGIPSKKGAR